jgi:pilus assembly protein CpaF
MATFLECCVAGRSNVLVTGAVGGPVASFLAALLSAGAPGERIAVLQDEDEIVVGQPQLLPLLLTDSGDGAEKALRMAASMHPDRLVVPGLRGPLATALLEMITEGSEGVIAGLRAPSLRQGIARLVALVTLQRPGLPLETAREWVCDCFDVVVEIGALSDGRPRVLRIADLVSDPKGVWGRDLFVAGEGQGDTGFTASGVVPRAVTELAARGVRVDVGLFKRPAGRN